MTLLDVHRQVINGCDRVMSELHVDTKSPDHLVLTALGLQQLHEAKALQQLAEAGFHDAAEPLLRAMSCAAISILAIADRDSGPRAAAYLDFALTTLDKWEKNLVNYGNLSPETAKRLCEAVAREWWGILEDYAERGIRPSRLGENSGYWAGVSDKELFKAMGREDWWAQYYAPFSDSAHASVSSMQVAIGLASAGRLNSGPRDLDGILVLSASSDLLIRAFTVLSNHFGVDAAELLDGLSRSLNTAMTRAAERAE